MAILPRSESPHTAAFKTRGGYITNIDNPVKFGTIFHYVTNKPTHTQNHMESQAPTPSEGVPQCHQWMKRKIFNRWFILLVLIVLLALVSQVIKYQRLPYSLATHHWKSIEIWYCIGDGPVVTKKSQRITDRETLDFLQKAYRPIAYEGLVLHYADMWNRIHITLANGQEAMLVLGRDDACFYGHESTAVGIQLENAFERELIRILQKNEEMPVCLHHNRFEVTVENQSSQLEPSIGGWEVVPYFPAPVGR